MIHFGIDIGPVVPHHTESDSGPSPEVIVTDFGYLNIEFVLCPTEDPAQNAALLLEGTAPGKP
jgi:hypothetical protein